MNEVTVRTMQRLLPIMAALIMAPSAGSLAQDAVPAISAHHAVPPDDAPNVLLVLMDDVGFSAASTFGGAVPTPNYEEIAAQGLRYNRFHVTAMCSPTRAALLTGRNHHRVEMGGIVNLAYGAEGYTSIIPASAATLGRVLQSNGYSTAWFGKNHVTPDWETIPTGPFDRWPTGLGFDYYYGFMGGATDQFSPDLVENTLAIDAPGGEDYILDRDLADRAIRWLSQQHSTEPDRPFLLYLAPGTAHVPLQAPREWIENFRGRFDAGWDALRQETFERQKRLGVIPADARLTPRPDSLPAWDSLNEKEKAVASGLMEVFAAQLAHFDEQFGRITDAIKATGEWENTLVIYIDGDNGADAAPGGIHGNVVEGLNGAQASVDYMFTQIDRFGGPRTFDGYPAGWAWATSTPFQYTKTNASHLGGTRAGMVISWPRRISDHGAVRSQFLHVIDIAPTVYDAIGIGPPDTVDGVPQMALDGRSFTASFFDSDAPVGHDEQYFELLGHRAYYEDGWMASTRPPSPQWVRKPPPPVEDYEWELYNLDNDYSQSIDLASSHPDKLAALKSGFDRAAGRNRVFPLDNRAPYRQRTTSLRPYVTHGRSVFEYRRTESRLSNAAFPDVRNRAWSLEVEVALTAAGDSGVLATQGGVGNGWGLLVLEGVPTFIYKSSDLPGDEWRVSAADALPTGRHTLKIDITPDSDTPGAGAAITMSIDDQVAVEGRADRTVPNTFPFFEGVGIGRDFVTSLTDDYEVPFRFSGAMGPVTVRLEE